MALCSFCRQPRCVGKCQRHDLQREISKLRAESREWEVTCETLGAELDRLVAENRKLRGETRRPELREAQDA